jgi:CsoR family transcriptional regulator, copper-sensing transcriptional repressor
MPSEDVNRPLELTEEADVALSKRLRRIEGQVRGLQKMVGDRRDCSDILVQIASVQEALRGVGKVLLQHHLSHALDAAIRAGDTDRSEQVVAGLVQLWGK